MYRLKQWCETLIYAAILNPVTQVMVGRVEPSAAAAIGGRFTYDPFIWPRKKKKKTNTLGEFNIYHRIREDLQSHENMLFFPFYRACELETMFNIYMCTRKMYHDTRSWTDPRLLQSYYTAADLDFLYVNNKYHRLFRNTLFIVLAPSSACK